MDYLTDTRSVLDQAIRVLQAMIDVCAEFGWGQTVERVVLLMQAIVQGRWTDDSTLSNVPGCDQTVIRRWWDERVECLPQLMGLTVERRKELARKVGMHDRQVDEMERYLRRMPSIDMAVTVNAEESAKKSKKRAKPVHIALITEALNEDGKLRPEKQSANQSLDEGELDSESVAPPAAPAVFHVHVTLRRTNADSNANIVTPTFTKPKQEGWYLLLTEPRTQQLLVLRRVNALPRNGQPRPPHTHLPHAASRTVPVQPAAAERLVPRPGPAAERGSEQ